MFDCGDVRSSGGCGGEAGGGVVEERLGRIEDVKFEVFATLDEVCMIQCGGKMSGIG